MSNIQYQYFFFQKGPSTQIKIGPDRVGFNSQVVLTSNGPFRQTVFAQVIDDMVALEDDEMVKLELTVDTPSSVS